MKPSDAFDHVFVEGAPPMNAAGWLLVAVCGLILACGIVVALGVLLEVIA